MPGGRDYTDQGPHHSDPEVRDCMDDKVLDGLTLAELQNNARHVLEFCLSSMSGQEPIAPTFLHPPSGGSPWDSFHTSP